MPRLRADNGDHVQRIEIEIRTKETTELSRLPTSQDGFKKTPPQKSQQPFYPSIHCMLVFKTSFQREPPMFVDPLKLCSVMAYPKCSNHQKVVIHQAFLFLCGLSTCPVNRWADTVGSRSITQLKCDRRASVTPLLCCHLPNVTAASFPLMAKFMASKKEEEKNNTGKGNAASLCPRKANKT